MKIGVICEGHADRAVITNIITGITGLDRSNILALRPTNKSDETDKAFKNPKSISSWSVIKEECEKKELINEFLAIEGQDFVVIHIDTAEAGSYGVNSPNKKSDNYCENIRSLVVGKINDWLVTDLSKSILYAVAVEEIDAWVLTIYEQGDSSKPANPKKQLSRVLAKKDLDSTSNYNNYLILSNPLSKQREITKNNYLSYNCSLKAFHDEVKTKVLPLL